MDTKELSNNRTTTDNEEVVGILMAISAVAKRLAKNMVRSEQQTKEGGNNYATKNAQHFSTKQ